MKRLLIIVPILLIYHLAMTAESGKIAGVITDSENGEPLIGVNVVIEGHWLESGKIEPLSVQMGAATDESGFYYILSVDPGRYAIKALMIGYEIKEVVDVLVESGRTVKINFKLKPAIEQAETVTVVAEREIIKLDVSSSQTVLRKEDTENLPIRNIEQVLNLTAGVNINPFDNKIEVRGGGSDQVMSYLDGFSMKDEIFNVPFLSFNRTSIKEITIQTGGFQAEYGDLRSGIIDVVTQTGGKNYSVSIDSRYAPPGYKYWGPHKYTEDKPFLIYGSDWSMDSTILHQKFPHTSDYFEGWPAYAHRYLTDNDSTNDLSPNQRRELWKWRHRGRKEGHLNDHVVDATLSGPVPGASLPFFGKYFFSKMNFMLSYRDQYDAYAHPAYRDHFGLQNGQLKLTYRFSPKLMVTVLGMNSTQSGMGVFESDGGNSAIIMHTGGGGTYNDTNNPLADIKTQNWGVSLKHILSKNTFYEIRANHLSTKYDFHHGPERDSTKIKTIPGEYYQIEEGDSLKVSGFWDKESNTYIKKDTVFTAGNRMWCPGISVDETPKGWVPYGAGTSEFDQPGKYDLLESSTSLERSSGWTTNIRGDITHQANKYHLLKAGFYFTKSKISRDWKHVINFYNDEWYKVVYDAFPLYYAGYLQDRLELKEFTANFGLRGELFDANSSVLSPDDPFNQTFYELYFRDKVDSLPTTPSKKYFRLSPRIGISHPLSAMSKVFFNYGHAYSSPRNSLRYSFRPKTYDWARPLWIGNPNLQPYKTIQYELGYEQVLFKNYLIHSAIYYKDVKDEAQPGHGIEYHKFGGGSQDFYYSWENNHYNDIIGFEFTLYKRFGRFVSGWAKTEFMGQKDGETGVPQKYLAGDPEAVSEFNTHSYPDDRLWDWRPSFLINIDLHIPYKWGPEIFGLKFLGGWRLNTVIDWRSGSRFTWNPELDPTVYHNLKTVDHFMDDIFFSRSFHLFGSEVMGYLDIHNLINHDVMNVGILRGLTVNPSSEIYQYYASLKKGDRVGDYKQDYLVRPKERPGEDYITRYGGPVRIYFGIRFSL